MTKTWDFRDDFIDDEYWFNQYVNKTDKNFSPQNENDIT